jgi:hypothetical protein
MSILYIVLLCSCGNSSPIKNASEEQVSESNFEGEKKTYLASGKGLYQEHCVACHGGINSNFTGRTFADIVKDRSIEWAHTYIRDSLILTKSSKPRLSSSKRHPIFISDISENDLQKIWIYVRASSGPVN